MKVRVTFKLSGGSVMISLFAVERCALPERINPLVSLAQNILRVTTLYEAEADVRRGGVAGGQRWTPLFLRRNEVMISVKP